MLLRALRPPMFFGASLPGMIFPAQRPAEGSNSYHYGSYATNFDGVNKITDNMFPYHYGSYATNSSESGMYPIHVSIPLWFLRNEGILNAFNISNVGFPYHYGSYATGSGSTNSSLGVKFPYHYGSYATKRAEKSDRTN